MQKPQTLLETAVTKRTVLLGAAEELRLFGHCAPGPGSWYGPKCVVLAINKASRGHRDLMFDAINQLYRTIGPGDHNMVTVWNERQTQASAIAMLERAALSQ
jgi:hypothetical protein